MTKIKKITSLKVRVGGTSFLDVRRNRIGTHFYIDHTYTLFVENIRDNQQTEIDNNPVQKNYM